MDHFITKKLTSPPSAPFLTENVALSIATNPFYFHGPLGFIASLPYTLLNTIFANYSAAYPNGRLDKSTIKTFFACGTNPDGTLFAKPGHEQIPPYWNKRPQLYGFPEIAADIAILAARAPSGFAVGGNTGKVNTFTGVDLTDLTGGVMGTKAFTDPQKVSCYLHQILNLAWRDFLKGSLVQTLVGTVLVPLVQLVNSVQQTIDPACPSHGVLGLDEPWADPFLGARMK